MKIRFIKDYKNHKKGDVIEATKNEAFGYIDSGYAIVDRMMQNYRTKKRG